MTDTPRRFLVSALMDRAADILTTEDWVASFAAGLLADTFAREEDTLYDEHYLLTADHQLNAALDAAALTVTKHVFDACNYKGLARRTAPAANRALDAAYDQMPPAPRAS